MADNTDWQLCSNKKRTRDPPFFITTANALRYLECENDAGCCTPFLAEIAARSGFIGDSYIQDSPKESIAHHTLHHT